MGREVSVLMGGTKAGGQKAHKTNVARYGKDYYARIGSAGGKKGGGKGGFKTMDKELVRAAGRKGGKRRWVNHERGGDDVGVSSQRGQVGILQGMSDAKDELQA